MNEPLRIGTKVPIPPFDQTFSKSLRLGPRPIKGQR